MNNLNLPEALRNFLGQRRYNEPMENPKKKYDLNVPTELKRIIKFREHKLILEDIVDNYSEWMGVIADIESRNEFAAIELTLEPAFKSLNIWKNDHTKYNYLKHKFSYVRRLKSALEKKFESIKSKRRVEPYHLPSADPPLSQPQAIQPTIENKVQPVELVYPEKQIMNWKYEPSLGDLVDYYKYKGVVGEESISILQTLGAINKLCFGLESLSGSGKSYVVEPLIDLLPEGVVYRMELGTKTAHMYNADEINKSEIIYIPELQKAMGKSNPIVIELLKGVTEGKDVTRTVRDQATRSNEKYVITGDKGVIFTLAVENQFKYDAEFSRRVFILHTDISEEQTHKILQFKASKRHAVQEQGFSDKDFEKLAAHVKECLEFTNVVYENPFADFIAEQIPRTTIRARSYDDYLFDLMDASAKFHFKDRVMKDGVLFQSIEDAYSIASLYWTQFSKGLLRIPVLGEIVMEVFDDHAKNTQDVYLAVRESNPGYTFKMVETTLETLVDTGFVEKDDYKSKRPNYSKVKDLNDLMGEIDWGECWEHGLNYMQEHYPQVIDSWLERQVTDDAVEVLDPLTKQQVILAEYKPEVENELTD